MLARHPLPGFFYFKKQHLNYIAEFVILTSFSHSYWITQTGLRMEITGIIATLLLITSAGVIAMLMSRLIRLPVTFLILCCGIAAAFAIPHSGFDTGIRADNFETLIMFVILPLLVFEASLELNLKVLRPLLAPVLYAATLGLVVVTLIAAVIIYFAIGHPSGFPFIAALITALLISTTDPATVVAQLRAAKSPEQLATLIEGESLFNDASAIVLFGVVLTLAVEQTQPEMTGVFYTLGTVMLGGIIIGAITGWLASKLADALSGLEGSLFVVGLLLTYGNVYIAEHLLDVSGVIAILVAGLAFNHFNPGQARKVQQQWKPVAAFTGLAVFFLMGLVVTFDMFTERWLAMLIGIVAAFSSRLVGSYVLLFVSRVFFRSALPYQYGPILTWGGLRGVVTLALVLSLPVELDYWWTIQSIGFGVVFFTLLVQAPTMGWLIKRLPTR